MPDLYLRPLATSVTGESELKLGLEESTRAKFTIGHGIRAFRVILGVRC